jgi:hypothetical protein
VTISTHTLRRFFGAAAVATCIVALGVPAALAGGSSGYKDGWYGYAVSLTKASHSKPTGSKLVDGRSPDTRDAALAAHTTSAPRGSSSRFGPPDGWYPYVLSLAQPNTATLLDGRSPDTKDAAQIAQERALTRADGRSPDTRDAAVNPRSIDPTTAGTTSFQWDDFTLGIGVAVGSMLLLLGSALAVRTTRRPAKTRSTVAA